MSDYAKQFGLSESGWYHRVRKYGLERAIAMGKRMKKGANSTWRDGPALRTENAMRQVKG